MRLKRYGALQGPAIMDAPLISTGLLPESASGSLSASSPASSTVGPVKVGLGCASVKPVAFRTVKVPDPDKVTGFAPVRGAVNVP